MIALDLDHPVLHGPAGAAILLKFFGKGSELVLIKRKTGNQGDTFSLAPLGLAFDTNDAVPLGNRLFPAAGTACYRLAARWAHAAALGGVDDS